MKLTNKRCENAESRNKPYKLSDGNGLYLEIMPNGSKYWRLKYRFMNKEKRLAFGVFPLVKLAEAREKREQARKLLASGIDPSEAKKETKRQAVMEASNTFEAVAREWHGNNKEKWSRAYPGKVMRFLEKDVFPVIGNRPIAQITAPELLECLRKVEKRGALDIAGRIRQICSQIFRYGIQTGRCEHDTAHALRGALRTRKTKHFPAIEAKELPDFIRAMERNDARLFDRTRRAIKLTMLTFCRPGEIRQAQWSEIDFDEKQWTIPAEKMKMRRDHIVPLSRQALAILKEQKEETGYLNTDWVFPSQIRPKEAMSDGTVNRAIKRLGYHERMVAHGFRALARTTIREKLNYDPDVIECQLAHKAAGPLGEAYNRVQHLDKRKKMMQQWADYLDAVAAGGKVVHGNFKKAG